MELGAENKGERLRHVTDPDGDTRPAKAGGLNGRDPATAQDQHFYFTIDDGYLFNETGLTCRLEVTYLDAAGFIEPQCDSTSTACAAAQRTVLAGSGEWKTGTWTLTDCRFANRQNAGADFRLFVGPNQVKVRRVKLLPQPAQQ